MGSIQQESHFKKIQTFKADYADATFTQYESQRTGLRVVVVDRKGPKVYGYFTVATEIHDDSGSPHTLEHLCFMGSRKYPYKGVLDKIATRSYSDTNAWTDTAETVYTLSTAGWEGFAQLLPIYLDHLVVPTLTDAGCYTEVHHIDGKGEDAGVVYSEMQGRENLQGDLMDLQMRRLLYPDGDGFRAETGGLMENLRVLSAERIRQFHRDMYQPKNLRLVLIGEVDHTNLLDVLDRFEDDIVDRVPSYDAPFKRPWVGSKRTPSLTKSVIDTVEFPEEDESTGEVQIAFFGPPATDDLGETALNTVLTYLAGSSVSILVNTLVEKEHLASEVYFWVKSNFDMIIWFTLSSVETNKLADAEKRFFEVLKEHASKPLDLSYMKDCLRRFKRQAQFLSETSNDEYNSPILKDHLYGNRDGSDLEEGMATLKVFDQLEEWTEEEWRNFMKKWLSDAHHVSLLGKPSIALSEKIKADEVARVKAQQEKFGEDGLKKLADKLKQAQDENDKPIPEGIIAGLSVPSTESIHFFETTTARSGLAKELGTEDNQIQKIVDQNEKNLPLFIHFEHIPTSFVHFGLALGTANIPTDLKPLLGVYLSNFFATPITKDGKRMEFEEVITKLEQDTIEYSMDRGSEIGNSEMIYITFVAEADKYPIVVQWLTTMLVDSVFDTERLIATVIKMLADVPDEKRDGSSMAFAVDRMIHYAPSSSVRATNTLVKARYLKRTLKLLKSTPNAVLEKLEALRTHLLTFSNLRLLVIADLTSLPNPVQTFSLLTSAIPPATNPPSLTPIDDRNAVLSPHGRSPGGAHFLIPMPIDSSFAVLTSAAPKGYTHPHLPALMVALAYLDAVEGPMWQSIRGTGLAYGTQFFRDVETGLLKFRIVKSPNAFSAFARAKVVVGEYADGTRVFERLALEGAISSIVREFVDERATVVDAARSSFVDLVTRGVAKDWQEWCLREVRMVGVEDVQAVLRDVVKAVFEPGTADLVVTCGGVMLDGLKKDFENAGFTVQVKQLADFSEAYGLEGDDEDDEVDDDDDDDDDEDDEDDESGSGETDSADEMKD
ncbi:zinc metalloprotease-like protein [Dothidotthia symphoricarpi CBS 119687]|uniref:Zinc metalloprotease-like protein n=1 Tax=Dothidotthia symphoricarpi CBS 119687 TaxID=1392245 RepID=A0A6A6AT45_9PLEO|nr:zinc metalloprotease-like protein [Dothidotthia symphoricarpi CBS 119687]KAF2134145.1 zinc metalloprotease-like protein [Dothidotthia symphoricarpi CBS 119687]